VIHESEPVPITEYRGVGMQNTKDLTQVRDGSLTAKVLAPDRRYEMEEARTFRYKIFLEELGWSLLESNGQEFDEYDENSVHFGAFEDSGQMVGYCRLILNNNDGFMIEKEFTDLVYPGYCIRKKDDTVEMSRFAITRERRGRETGIGVMSVLVRCVYRWAEANRVRYIYGVCASNLVGHIKESFSCAKQIGPDHEYQPGVSSAAFIVDLEKLDVTQILKFWFCVVGEPWSQDGA
jgi:N-acyl-L-homoserine lactone synthetase